MASIVALIVAFAVDDSSVSSDGANEVLSVCGLLVSLCGVYTAAYAWAWYMAVVAFCDFFLKFAFRIAFLAEILTQDGVDSGYRSTECAISILVIIIALVSVLSGASSYRYIKAADKQVRVVVIIGLSNSGKSTLLSHVVPVTPDSLSVEINPTAGLQLREFRKWGTSWRVFDMSGHGRAREMWQSYYSDVDCIVFVVDCSDPIRIGSAQEELFRAMKHPDVVKKRPALLVFGNKSDLSKKMGENAIDYSRLESLLQINNYASNHQCKVMASNGIAGTSVDEGFQWISSIATSKDSANEN